MPQQTAVDDLYDDAQVASVYHDEVKALLTGLTRARFTIHSSFEIPDAPADAPPRESIETRCLVFF